MDVANILNKLKDIPISIQCWQGDDVGGFETKNSALSGAGIISTGSYPGKARNILILKKGGYRAESWIYL